MPFMPNLNNCSHSTQFNLIKSIPPFMQLTCVHSESLCHRWDVHIPICRLPCGLSPHKYINGFFFVLFFCFHSQFASGGRAEFIVQSAENAESRSLTHSHIDGYLWRSWLESGKAPKYVHD